jgi:dCMP deaminase
MDPEAGSRPSFEELMMETALLWSQRGTCSRLQVGAVLALDNRILAQGYNGAVAGMDHCRHDSDRPCDVAVHAEENVLYFAAKHGLATNGTTLYVTHDPCYRCARGLINAGVSRVYSYLPYRDPRGVDLLRSAGVHVQTLDFGLKKR